MGCFCIFSTTLFSRLKNFSPLFIVLKNFQVILSNLAHTHISVFMWKSKRNHYSSWKWVQQRISLIHWDLILEYNSRENSFVQLFDSYSNDLPIKILISQYFYYKMQENPSQFQKLGVAKEISDWFLLLFE